MDKEMQALYYKCIDRLDDELEKAESYLISCITFLHRKEHGRADKDRIREDFSLNRGVYKYKEELTIISRLPESSLSTLIASSLDLSPLVEEITNIHEKVNNAIYDDVEANSQSVKIRKAIAILQELSTVIRDKKGNNKKTVQATFKRKMKQVKSNN